MSNSKTNPWNRVASLVKVDTDRPSSLTYSGRTDGGKKLSLSIKLSAADVGVDLSDREACVVAVARGASPVLKESVPLETGVGSKSKPIPLTGESAAEIARAVEGL